MHMWPVRRGSGLMLYIPPEVTQPAAGYTLSARVI